MENAPKLGAIIGRDENVDKDAIHVAIAPMVLARAAYPNARVGVVAGLADPQAAHRIGIVDPFLTEGASAGDRVWVLLFPGTVTSLRHEWLHPAFAPEPTARISKETHVAKSEEWIVQHANALGLSRDALMADAADWLDIGDYFVQRDRTTWRDNFNPREFWHHYEIVMGTVVPEDKKGGMYCCSC